MNTTTMNTMTTKINKIKKKNEESETVLSETVLSSQGLNANAECFVSKYADEEKLFFDKLENQFCENNKWMFVCDAFDYKYNKRQVNIVDPEKSYLKATYADIIAKRIDDFLEVNKS